MTLKTVEVTRAQLDLLVDWAEYGAKEKQYCLDHTDHGYDVDEELDCRKGLKALAVAMHELKGRKDDPI